MIKKRWFILSLLIALILFLTPMQQVFAQKTDTEEFTLEEITVTAQKREENQQKVAIAMEVISGEETQELGKNNIDEILSSVASAIVFKSSEGLRVSIRGISQAEGTFFGLQTSVPTVALNADGVYSNRNTGGQNLFDIERVEILYGPQSTMYASTTPGGIVNIITADPKIDNYEISGSLEYGNYNLMHFEGMINTPLNDKFALRAAYSGSARDGYLSNGGDDEDAKVIRLKALFRPTDRFSILVAVEKQKIGGQGYAGAVEFVNQDDVADPWASKSNQRGTSRITNRTKIYGRINMGLGIGDLSITPSRTTSDWFSHSSTRDWLTFQPITQDNTGDSEERGLEARATSPEDSPIKWIVGYNWYRSRDNNDTDSFLLDGTLYNWGKRYNYQLSKAAYGNVTYPFTKSIRGSVGYRYTWDKNESYNNELFGPPDKTMPEFFAQNYNHPDYKVGMEYDLADDNMLYADWSTGFRLNGSFEYYPPEQLTSFTIGSKNRFLGKKLQVNAAAYIYNYKDQETSTGVRTIVDENGNGKWDVGETRVMLDEDAKSTGDQKVYGLELQTSTIITEKDKLDLSVAYDKKTWTRLFFNYWDITNSIGIPDLDYSGKRGTYAPLWTVQATYRHNFQLSNEGIITVRYDGRYQSEYNLSFLDYRTSLNQNTLMIETVYTQKYTRQEAYIKHDFSATYAHPDGKWTLSAYVKNISNYAVKVSVTQNDELMLASPRTYGAVLNLKY